MKKENFFFVVDNFFKQDYFEKLKNKVIQQNYSPRTVDYEGDSQKLYHHIPLDTKDSHCQHTYETIKKQFNHEINFDNMYVQSFFFLSFGHETPNIHQDSCMFNCMIYIQGENLLQNGTSFYIKDKDEQFVLHSVLGFQENRAVLFDGSIYHASSQYMDASNPRYMMTNFIWSKND
jgi:hypothetical protein|tara:strand:- start:663 stop:1190 length:528 start_codon:yes stop_codon:yes gene_type:complete